MTEQQTKVKKSVAKRSARDASLEASRKNGESLAILREVPTSPRKMRLVADLMRGQQVSYALNVLKHEKAHPSIRLEKLLLSAVANWQLKYPDSKLEDAGLFVKEIYVGGGKMLKRVQPAPQGRAHRIRKRSNHVTLVLGSNLEETQAEKDQKINQKDGAEG